MRSIDEKRSRQANRAHRPQCLAGAVDIYRKLLHVAFREHFADRVDPLAIDRYCDDCEVRTIHSRSEMVERGNFLDARCAPSGPDIEQHDLASEVGETSRPTLIILKADHGTWFRCFVHDEASRRLLCPSDQHPHKHRTPPPTAL